MGADDELHSVRVEVEGAVEVAAPTVPVGDHGSAGAPKWVVALAILVVGVVGAVVLLLSSGDSAADGTERQALERNQDGDGGGVQGLSTDPETDTQGTIGTESSTAAFGDAIVPTRVLLDGGRAIQILSGDLGFFALIQRSGSEPTILRSADGEDWFEANSTVMSRGIPNSEPLDWFSMSVTNGRFVLRAAPIVQDGSPPGEVFTSFDGTNWQHLEGFGSLRESPSTGFPVAFAAGSSFTFELTGIDILERYLGQYTTLELPADGVCGINAGALANGETSFTIGSCLGGLASPLDASDIVGDVPAADVFACMNDLSDAFAGTSVSFVRRDIADATIGVELFDLRPMALPVSLSNGAVVVPDAGPIVDVNPESCAGLIELPQPVTPGMVVVDARTNELIRWPFPNGADFEGERFFSVQPLGEFVRADGGQMLLTVFEENLWALDLTSGRWTGPLSPTVIESTGLDGTAAISESGERVYVVDGANLVTFDIIEDPAAPGTVIVRESVQAIDVSNAAAFEFGGEILQADDDLVFFSDGVTVWTLEPPGRTE